MFLRLVFKKHLLPKKSLHFTTYLVCRKCFRRHIIFGEKIVFTWFLLKVVCWNLDWLFLNIFSLMHFFCRFFVIHVTILYKLEFIIRINMIFSFTVWDKIMKFNLTFLNITMMINLYLCITTYGCCQPYKDQRVLKITHVTL